MKVFIDGYIFWLQRTGGIVRYWSELTPRMAEMDRSSEFFIYFRAHSKNNFHSQLNLKFLEQRLKLPTGILNSFEERRLAWWCLKIKPDIFHSTYYTTIRSNKVHKIVTVHDMIYELFPQFFGNKKAISFIEQKRRAIIKSKKIITVSKNTKKDLMSLYNLPEEKIIVIYEGVSQKFKKIIDNDLLRDFKKRYEIEKPYFLYIGRRALYKNFITLLKAYALFPQRENFQLLLIGGEKEFSPLEVDIINRLKINDAVKHIKEMSEADLILAYNSAVALVFPSLYEGFGLPILEAMVCGTPVVCSDTSSMPEIAGDAAIYFNPNEVDDMVNGLNKVLKEELSKKLSVKGMRRVKKFSWMKTANQTLQVYKQAIG